MTVYRRPDPVPRTTQGDAPASKLEPIRENRKELSTLAAQRIFSAIASKNWAQTGLLPREDILGQELGVSRTVVREAVKSLSSKSIVEARRRRGTVILDQSDWNFVDSELIGWMSESPNFQNVGDQLIDALAVTQTELLARIVQNDLDSTALGAQARLIAGTATEAAVAALMFHRIAAQIYQNDFLMSLTSSIVHGLQQHHIERLARSGFGSDAKHYFSLCDAIGAKDADAVRTLNALVFSKISLSLKPSHETLDAVT